MKIALANILSKDAVPVFLLHEGGATRKHQFFKLLAKDDRNHITAFLKKSPPKADCSHLIFMPSKREALLLGVAAKDKFSHRKAFLAARRIVSLARSEKLKHIAVSLDGFLAPGFLGTTEALAEALATQVEIANFEFVKYKTAPQWGWFFVDQISVLVKKHSPQIAQALARGKIIGEEINSARTISNTPGGDMTPIKLAEAAVRAGENCKFKVSILNEKEIRRLGMGGIIGVSRGSTERPRFIIMEHLKGGKNEKPVVLVGKGVTFDTGGLNIKEDEHMSEMHMDMSGGAAVIHILSALSRLKTKKNVIGIVPAVENMPSGSSYHPGDLLKTMSGKTIEVLNTDAEGRVILADALEYSKKYKPRLVVDIATLTGAAVVALGQRASALFTTSEDLERALRSTGEQTGDFVWPLPLWEEYEEDIKGTFGDVANIGKTRYGGAVTAAAFLWQFIKDSSAGSDIVIPWVHIDIAPRMTSIEGDYLAKGAAGAAIALLVKFLRES